MLKPGYLNTGQTLCYDAQGEALECAGSFQDADLAPGAPWPEPRFEAQGEVVLDRLTGLTWARNADLAGFPLTWTEALSHVAGLNAEPALGRSDWRLPNRRELRSLLSFQDINPALHAGHPFENVRANWFWTATTSAVNTAYAWYVHLAGGRMFYGKKDQYCLVWPVCGQSEALPRTGQVLCYGADGELIDCAGSGQDGELRMGAPWPEPRFEAQAEVVLDRLTGLSWTRTADLAGPVDWPQALEAMAGLREQKFAGLDGWRLPTINELESLVDASAHDPALPAGHPFANTREVYWSSTTSAFETDWCMALYLHKGAVGVGHKTRGDRFAVWGVCGKG